MLLYDVALLHCKNWHFRQTTQSSSENLGMHCFTARGFIIVKIGASDKRDNHKMECLGLAVCNSSCPTWGTVSARELVRCVHMLQTKSMSKSKSRRKNKSKRKRSSSGCDLLLGLGLGTLLCTFVFFRKISNLIVVLKLQVLPTNVLPRVNYW